MSNIATDLKKSKEKELLNLTPNEAVQQVLLLENTNAQEDLSIAMALGRNNIVIDRENFAKKLEMEKLDGKYHGNVYTKGQIKDLARKYNLRFLAVSYFTGAIDVEVISKLKRFRDDTNTEITPENLKRNYYVLAPESCFQLQEVKQIKEKYYDPALFYQIDENHYRMIHQWGSDFNIWNRIQGFKWSSRKNLGIFRFIVCFMIVLPLVVCGMQFHWTPILGLVIPIFAYSTAFFDDTETYSNLKFHEHKWKSDIKVVGSEMRRIPRMR